jgi:hypothetical protein
MVLTAINWNLILIPPPHSSLWASKGFGLLDQIEIIGDRRIDSNVLLERGGAEVGAFLPERGQVVADGPRGAGNFDLNFN